MEVQVRVNIRCGREGAVSKPDLNLLYRYSACQQQASAAMSEIVEANLFESEFFKQLVEMLCDINRAHELTGLVETNVIEIFPAVRAFCAQSVLTQQ